MFCSLGDRLPKAIICSLNNFFDLINKDGEFDDYLNYNINDIYGMVYFLTGKCHLNWKEYDNI